MAALSPARAGWPVLSGLQLMSRGKVRDTYRLPDKKLLVVATDGISIFDFVLNALVPMKGIILNAMNYFWLKKLSVDYSIPTHLCAAGAEIDKFLPVELRNHQDLQSRAMVVRELKMADVEFIFRMCLTGSGLAAYNKTKQVCGHCLPEGLQDGDKLPYILDTPTTKAKEGHDEHISAQEVRQQYPELTLRMLSAVQIAKDYAESRGILLADTKLEGGEGIIGDEVFTPDSSRFWDLKEWQNSRKPKDGRKSPSPFDKQLVRAWGITQGINKLDPSSSEDVAMAHSLSVPDGLIRQTTKTYRYIFWRLTGMTIENYLRSEMGVASENQEVKNIVVVCGSSSDLPVVDIACKAADVAIAKELPWPTRRAKIRVHVMSCHRNSEEVREFARRNWGSNVDAVICAGGKAFALPGVLDAAFYAAGRNIPVIGVALGDPGSRALEAAKLSIEEIPDAPVIMDEINGTPYVGYDGIYEAILRITSGELPPAKPRTDKPVQMDVWTNF